MKDEEEPGIIRDMTGDMSDDEFEKIAVEITERIKDQMYMVAHDRVREALDAYRSELLVVEDFELKFKFSYTRDVFNEILGRIRRRRE